MKGLKRLSFALASLAVASSAFASSHREAPFITEFPKVDGTDFYLFTSYEAGRSEFVTLIADYVPLQDAYGGPNYFSMDPEAFYDIHIDNNADARADLTFRFRFTNINRNLSLNVGGTDVAVPLINVGAISAGDSTNLNVLEQYSVRLIRDRRGSGRLVTNSANGLSQFVKPVDNIGNKSIPNYETYANQYIYGINIPGCAVTGGKLFVGQRKEPFAVNLGETFDLINYADPVGSVSGETNTVADKNVTSLILELPKSCVLRAGRTIISGWTTSSLPKEQVLRRRPSFSDPTRDSAALIQMSRLANPLVNELVIGLKDKNKFNESVPTGDAQFLTYVSNPTLPALIQAIFNPTTDPAGVLAPTVFPRTDLIAVFLTGVDGLNKDGSTAEVMRLNTATPPLAAAAQDRLGVIAGDNAGYPNGRRPGDDVVDISLRVVMGKLISDVAQAPSGALPFTDGAVVSATDFQTVFPYLNTPLPGSPN